MNEKGAHNTRPARACAFHIANYFIVEAAHIKSSLTISPIRGFTYMCRDVHSNTSITVSRYKTGPRSQYIIYVYGSLKRNS